MQISQSVTIPDNEIDLQAMRAQGAGGQNVNKVSSAIHLRFDIAASSLPDFHKQRLLKLSDYRVTKDGIIVIKSQEHSSQELNRQAALARLQSLIRDATALQKARRKTRPSRSAKRKRVDSKTKRGKTKSLRGRVF